MREDQPADGGEDCYERIRTESSLLLIVAGLMRILVVPLPCFTKRYQVVLAALTHVGYSHQGSVTFVLAIEVGAAHATLPLHRV